MPRVTPETNSSDLALLKNKMCDLGSLLRPGGPWSVTWGPEFRVRKVAHFPIFINLELLFCEIFD